MIKSRNAEYTAEYRYDALGRRIQKRSKHHHTGDEQNVLYGWKGNTLAFESNDQVTKHYVYEKGSFVPLVQAVYTEAIELHQTPDWSDKPYSLQRDPLWKTSKKAKDWNDVWFYHCDHLGTPQEMTDHTGAVIWKAEYKAWGECKSEKAKSNFFENSEIISNNIRFQGQYFDQETGLHYNRYRYYSPYVGRFISKDPIGLLGGHNVYAYAPNPVGWIDPLGLNKNCPPTSGWLQHHENGVNNGHTIDKHVGKTDTELKDRLDNSITSRRPRGLSGSSSYTNQQTAENAISGAYKQVNPLTGNTNRVDVKNWNKTANAGDKMVIEYKGNGVDVTGRGLARGQTTASDRYDAKVVLKSTGNGKYTILTSHPE